jgi:hypothetical protein
MARPDKVYASWRGVVAGSNLTGVWGDATAPDLICVDIDASGLLIASGADAAKGVIWTPEGKSESGVANFNVALAGSVMTVFTQAQFTGTFDGTPALTAGDEVWAAAAGDVVDSAPGVGGQLIGFMAASDENDVRLILNVSNEMNAGT